MYKLKKILTGEHAAIRQVRDCEEVRGHLGKENKVLFLHIFWTFFHSGVTSVLMYGGLFRYPHRCCSAESHPRVPDQESNQEPTLQQAFFLSATYTTPHKK